MIKNLDLSRVPQDYLAEQAILHPTMRPRDMIKLCFQAAYGAEHLMFDQAASELLFYNEFSSVSGGAARLYEQISPDFCRVNLVAWKERGLPSEWLLRMFVSSAPTTASTDSSFRSLLRQADMLCAAGSLPFSQDAWAHELNAYWLAGGGAIRHSEHYRAHEQPTYRLVCTRFIRLFALLERLATCSLNDSARVVALDGRAASGKTTMADQLSLVLGAGIVHMDDFFLPEPLRSENRLAEPGGNVYYERFAQEVLPEVSQTTAFSYRRFDCSKMALDGIQEVRASQWRIVEGAYSCHSYFGNYADIKVFCDVETQEQMRRIENRNGTEKAEIFASCWIPLEERYFDQFGISEKADIIL
ncbi:MAG TPA: hypothetical protein VN626_10565 [Clostridia bacterium]|nr:hypothetical protein [Clostridia bacterium]